MMRKNLRAVHTLWLREMLRFKRSTSQIIGSLAMPLLFLLVLGPAFNSSFQLRDMPFNYIEFLAPGIIGMTVLFPSMMSGVSIIWDREFGFLREILISPVNRFFVALGKALGGVTTAMIQGISIMIIAGLFGVKYTSWLGALLSIPVMLIIGLGFIGLGIAFASKIESHEGFQMVMSFIMMPIFFLSGAMFPIDKIPAWLQFLAYLDPLTYGIDALRYVLLGYSILPPALDIAVSTAFALLTLWIGAYLFERTTI